MASRKMNPALKKVMTAVAVKEGIDRIQSMRRPKQSFVRRHSGAIAIIAVGSGLALLAMKRSQIKAALGGDGPAGYKDEYPTGPITEPVAPQNGGDPLERSTVV